MNKYTYQKHPGHSRTTSYRWRMPLWPKRSTSPQLYQNMVPLFIPGLFLTFWRIYQLFWSGIEQKRQRNNRPINRFRQWRGTRGYISLYPCQVMGPFWIVEPHGGWNHITGIPHGGMRTRWCFDLHILSFGWGEVNFVPESWQKLIGTKHRNMGLTVQSVDGWFQPWIPSLKSINPEWAGPSRLLVGQMLCKLWYS